MLSTKITTFALMAMFSATSLAAAIPNAMDTVPIHQIDTRDWVSVEFEGKTINYNPAAFNASSEDTEGTVSAKRADANDVCKDSSYSGTEGPWPNESDCAVLGDWVSRQKKTFDVWANTPDYHGVVNAGTCVFGAGTRNFLGAKIGSSDISAAISESIKRFAIRNCQFHSTKETSTYEMIGQGELKVIALPQFATDFEVIDISDEIQEEIIAINSIYGDGTWEIETTYNENGSSKIRTKLRPPAQDPFEDDFSLKIVLPSTYPHQRPEFKGANKWSKLPQRERNICMLIFVAIHQLFEPGSVCMYETLEYVADRSSLLDDSGMLDARKSRGVAPGLVDELQWTLWKDLDVSNIAGETICTVCMDEGLAFQMAPLPCGCHYCMTCFAVGWDVAFRALEPYTCCLERVPVSLIESRIRPEPNDVKRYSQMLVARDTAHPFFCSYFKNCGKLVGGFDEKALRLAASKRGGGGVLCRSCGLWSCAKCRTPKHTGDCVSDPDMAKLFETADIRRCPKCSEAIEKNGGCPHMKCRSCGSHWWWKKTGALVPFRGYGLHDDNDWF